MARRRRLTPPEPAAGADLPDDLETKSRFPLGVARTVTRPTRAPIAEVAGESAERAALAELTREVTAAREEGRLVQRLALDAVETGHLVRDRMNLDEEEMQTLVHSLRARGQQSPVEVVALEGGRFGLISGWRRVEALRRIGAGTVLAFVRRPETSAEAYLAMVEENEVRSGLSFYERGRLAAEAVKLGLFADAPSAVAALFASAPAPRRSKILSFVALHQRLGDALRFPTAIPERLGIALVAALEREGFPRRLRDSLRKAAPGTAEAERAVLERALRRAAGAGRTAEAGDEVAPGVFLRAKGRGLTLSGPGVTADLRRDLAQWLSARESSAGKSE
jgi:ParB family chromosome partitioning protein